MPMFNDMKSMQARAPTQAAPLVNPRDIPALIPHGSVPSDFKDYTYAGAAMGKWQDKRNDTQRGLVAKMVLRSGDPEGASAVAEMEPVSVRDLIDNRHPQAAYVERILNEHHLTNVQTKAPSAPASSRSAALAVLKKATGLGASPRKASPFAGLNNSPT